MQAQDADRPGVVQEPVRDALELGGQHVALLRVVAELVHPLLDRLQVERRQRVDCEERIVRTRQRRCSRRNEAAVGAQHDRVALLGRTGAALAVDAPRHQLRCGALTDALTRPQQLGPRVGLMPVHPAAAELDLLAAPLRRPRATAEAVARLDQRAVESRERQLARGRDAREASADDDRIEHAPSLAES